jgi:hypothetical protein
MKQNYSTRRTNKVFLPVELVRAYERGAKAAGTTVSAIVEDLIRADLRSCGMLTR